MFNASRRVLVLRMGMLLITLLPIHMAAALTSSFTYQGSIDLSGQPANGACDFQFTLWDAAGAGAPPSGGAQIGSPQSAGAVSVNNGVFSTALDFGTSAFDGNDRWLQIAARCPAGAGSYTTLSPRQALTPAPYARFADNAGGLQCSGCVDSADLGSASVVAGKIATAAVGGNEIADGSVTSDDINSSSVQRRVTGSCAGGVSQINQDGTVQCAPLQGDITSVNAGSGLSGGGVTGDATLNVNFAGSGSASSAAHSDHDHFGQSWSGSMPSGLQIYNSATDGTAIRGQADFGTNAIGVIGQSQLGIGVFGYSPTNTATYGLSTDGLGVLGSSTNNNGVEGRTFNANHAGVRGVGNNNNAIGVWGTGNGSSSAGVQGDSPAGTGVYGTSSGSFGVHGASANGVGVYGATGATLMSNAAGVFGESTVAAGVGVVGTAASGSSARGVWGISGDGTGVYGTTTAGVGVIGESQARAASMVTVTVPRRRGSMDSAPTPAASACSVLPTRAPARSAFWVPASADEVCAEPPSRVVARATVFTARAPARVATAFMASPTTAPTPTASTA